MYWFVDDTDDDYYDEDNVLDSDEDVTIISGNPSNN